MTAPVLKDLKNQDFTEGDRVVYASTNGIRVGKVSWIRTGQSRFTKHPVYKVYIDLGEHTSLERLAPGKMFAAKMGYEYFAEKFLKL